MTQNKLIRTTAKSSRATGAIAVEYAFAVMVAGLLIFAGIPLLFETSKELLAMFVGWLQPHYP